MYPFLEPPDQQKTAAEALNAHAVLASLIVPELYNPLLYFCRSGQQISFYAL